MDSHRQLKELKQAAPYIAVYSLFWGCTYLYLYWSKFNVNPFSYIGPGEIITSSGKFLFQSSIFTLGILLCETFFSTTEEDEETRKRKIKDLKTIAVIILAMTATALYFAQYTVSFYFAALGFVVTLTTPISYLDIFRHSFSSRPVRTAIAALIVTLPILSIVTAQNETKEILDNTGKLSMIRRSSDTCMAGCILIGKIGDYFAVLGKSGKVIMIKNDEMKQFEIYEYDFGK
ncbi:hypothetical protein [Pseudomonas sp.]|uniref:hypothetical protein n=1 Tax=Pseudomonas sp. TaxID=306 RepID=UPI0031B59A36